MPKNDNTFRFVGFLDRLKDIHVDIIRNRSTFSELPGRDADSFFYETLEKWTDLDGTQYFDDFKRGIPSNYDLQTYAQVLHHQSAISGALQRHLSVEGSLCLPALLELTIAFGRDMQKDFYDGGHFWSFFNTILSLIVPDLSPEQKPRSKNYDPELMENAFSTLAHLFKLCWRPLARCLSDVYDRFRPVLNHKRPYVRRFASEALSFLVRKSTDLKNFLFIRLKEDDDFSDLLFESMRGTTGRLHSKAADILSTAMDLLEEEDGEISEKAFAISESLHTKLSSYATGEIAKPVLVDVLLRHAVDLVTTMKSGQEIPETRVILLEKYLRLLYIWRINSKKKTFFNLCFPNVVRDLLMPIVDDESILKFHREGFVSALLELASSIFGQQGAVDECRCEFETFTTKALGETYDGLIPLEPRSKYITRLAETSSEGCGVAFETLCLPQYGKLVERMLSKDNENDVDLILETFCHILTCKDPMDDSPNTYDLFPGLKMDNLKRVLEERVFNPENSADEWTDSKMACIIALYSRIGTSNSGQRTGEVLMNCLANIVKNPDKSPPLVLYAVVHSLIQSGLAEESVVAKKLRNLIPLEKWIQILDTHQSMDGFVWSLRAAEQFFGSIREGSISIEDELFLDTIDKWSEFFTNSSHSVRLETARLLARLQHLHSPSESRDDQSGSTSTIFDVFFEAESIFPLHTGDYRDRLLNLRKLSFEEYERSLPMDTKSLKLIPLKMLIGQLHVNFALMWDPVVDLIATHLRGFGMPGNGADAHAFWQYFSDILQMASKRTTDPFKETDENEEEEDTFYYFWYHQMSEAVVDDDRPDYSNFRYLLWKAVEICSPECVEWKSRNLSPLILELAEKELRLFNDDPAKVKWENLVDAPWREPHEERNGEKGNVGIRIKTMIAMLRTYSKFQNMKGIAKEPDMAKLFNKLLMYQRRDVQRASLECIFSYKSKNLLPYKDYFTGLLDDTKFRDALISFQIDASAPDGSVIDPNHRSDVTPILIRLLYGLMWGKAGSRRKMPIFHFLASCDEDELKSFLKLFLVPMQACLAANQGPLIECCQSIVQNYNLRQSICPRQLLGIFTNLHIVFRKLGHVFSDDSKSGFWRLLALTSGIIDRFRRERKADRVHRKYRRVIKELYRGLLSLLVDFFTCFGDTYNPNSAQCVDDLKALFITTCSTQNLEKFANGEGVKAMTGGLLSLFHCWSQNPKLAPFMEFSIDDSITPIGACAQVLTLPTCPRIVQTRLVTILRDLSSHPTVTRSDGQVVESVVLLKPYVTDLFSYMQRKLSDAANGMNEAKARGQGRRRIALSELDLQLLSKITICVNDPEPSECLTSLLLPCLGTKLIKSEAAATDALFTVCRLVKNVPDCGRFQEVIARLFSVLKHRNSRTLLCELWCAAFVENRRPIGVLDSEWEQWEFMAKIIRDWNSWDRKRLDDPDYGRRTTAYNETRRRIECGDDGVLRNVHFCRLILHECAFVVLENEDMSLRDNAAYTLRKLIQSLPKYALQDLAATSHPLINSDLLPILRKGVKSIREEVRLEFVGILSSVVQAFPQHPRFAGLYAMAPAGGDQDVDLFENLRHMQLHRRTRALRRLRDKIEEENASSNDMEEVSMVKIVPDTIYQYILPVCLPWPYVDIIVTRQSTLVEEVVRLITTYARHQSSWKRYESLLKYFLTRLQKDPEKRKMTVKLLTGLLDGFPFDLKDVKIEESVGELVENELPVEEGKKTKWKIFSSLTKYYLPRLQKVLSQPLQTETVHRMMEKSHYDEDEQVVKIPIALALIKLLKKLPVVVLETSLPGIQYKVCQLLKSRSFTIREQTRKALCSMTIELGPRYLPFVIREMRSILTRGYQVHVLIYTIHALLNALSDALQAGDLDVCLDDILEICNEDLFGGASEEKEVVEYTKNLKEARAQKTYATYLVIGRLVGVGCLDKALEPLRKTLETKHSYKTVSRVSTALRHFATGLCQNSGLNEEVMLVFVHGTLRDCLPMLSEDYGHRPSGMEEFEEEESKVRQKSCLLLDPEPGRCGALSTTPKLNRRSNIHVIVEFALDTLLLVFKKAGSGDDVDQQKRIAMLDPFIDLLYQCSTTMYSRTVAHGLRCLCHLAQSYSDQLPSFQNAETREKVINRLFVLLGQYAGLGRAGNPAKGSEFAAAAEVLTVTFKTMAVIIHNLDTCTLKADQLKMLLCFVDEDLMDSRRQAAAFALIRAIIGKRYRCPKDPGGNDLLTTVMNRIQEMSIQSQAEHIRAQCRQLVVKYGHNYGLLKGNKAARLFRFYCAQLSYEYEDGRVSALECLNLIFDHVSKKSLSNHSSMIFVFLAMRLIEDESPKCKKVVGVTLKNLIRKIEPTEVNALFAMSVAWLQNDKAVYKQLGAHLLRIFVEAEEEKFRSRLTTIVPALSSELMKLREKTSTGNESGVEEEELAMDKTIHLVLTAVKRISDLCPSLMRNEPECVEKMNEIWDTVKSLLRYPHQSVQLISSQLFGLLFASYTPDELSVKSVDCVQSQEYLMRNEIDENGTSSRECMWRELSEAFIGSLRMQECQAALAEQTTKNLVFVARVVLSNDDDATNGEKSRACNLAWLSRRLVGLCRYETAKSPRNFTKRSCVFKWIAAVALHIPKEKLDSWLPIVLPPLYREATVGEDADSEMKELTSEVCDFLKTSVAGIDTYSRHWVTCQGEATERRVSRKRKIAEEAVSNPEAAARRKIRKHQKKTESRKRKFTSLGKNPKRIKRDKGMNVGLDRW